jgi:hypothetical protein
VSGSQISWLGHILVFVAASIGFACLALSMDRHQEDLFGDELRPALTRGLRTGGWLMLSAGLVAAVRSQGWSFGLVAYSGHTSVAAWLVFMAMVMFNRLHAKDRR